jgi:hypothetical protein
VQICTNGQNTREFNLKPPISCIVSHPPPIPMSSPSLVVTVFPSPSSPRAFSDYGERKFALTGGARHISSLTHPQVVQHNTPLRHCSPAPILFFRATGLVSSLGVPPSTVYRLPDLAMHLAWPVHDGGAKIALPWQSRFVRRVVTASSAGPPPRCAVPHQAAKRQ